MSIPNAPAARAIEVIPLDRIDLDPKQPRRTFDPSLLQSLAASIEREGLINPITVIAQPNGRFILDTGERRFRAHQILRRTAIEAITLNEGEGRRRRQLAENLEREALSPFEIIEAIDAHFGGQTDAASAAMLNRSQAWVSKLRGLSRFDDRCRALAIRAGIKDADILYSLARLDAVDHRRCHRMLLSLAKDPGSLSRAAVLKALQRAANAPAKPPALVQATQRLRDTVAHGRVELDSFGRSARGLRATLTFQNQAAFDAFCSQLEQGVLHQGRK